MTDEARPPLAGTARLTLFLYLAVTGLVLLLMMALGLLMRLAQGGWLNLAPKLFYELMTVHGVGMVGIAAFGGAAIMWNFLSGYVRLSTAVLVINLVLFLAGVVAILVADMIGGFGGAWTFLYPLPRQSAGVWSQWSAALHLGGLLVIGGGFLLLMLDAGRAIAASYGGLARALGWPQLFGGSKKPAPPPTVVASTMVVIVNTLALTTGATIIVMSLINLVAPSFAIDPLLAKNMTYFFGHVFINASIYMAVIGVYEILPRYTKRPWKASRVFLAAWTASTVMVMIIYPHHLLMDFVMPSWALIVGQVFSFTNSFPVLAVTGFGALTLVYKSGVRWDIVTVLLFVAMFGWMAGVIPAVIDALVVVNLVMHNTMWVPGHFHFYLLLGLLPMIFGFMYYSTAGGEAIASRALLDRLAFKIYLLAALGFVAMFLYAGRHSVPRRWAVHLPQWMLYDQIASVFSVLVLLMAAVFILRFLFASPRFLKSP